MFFDDCWLCPTQSPTLIPAPRPGTHNSCWLQSPGSELVRGYPGDAALKQRLHTYVHTVLSRFAEDPRILAWDLYNEPGNRATIRFDDKGAEIPGDRRATPTPEGTKALLEDVFAWAWEVNPAQPLTSGVWSWLRPGDHPIARVQYDRSDVISFHNYGNLQDMRKTVTMVRAHAQGRPIICTEYMARPTGSTFQDILPFLAAENISAINWGFVSGKSQTICSWTSWKSPELPPRRWFHDIYHPDGKAYDPAEVECIRKTSAAKTTSNTPNQ